MATIKNTIHVAESFTNPVKWSHVNWKNRLFDSFVFLWFLALTLYVTQQRSYPYIYDDEYGVLGAAAVFAGYDWTTPATMPFYGFLLSIFTFPLYWLDLEPTMLYRSVLAVNAILVATSAVLALRTIRMLPETHSEPLRIMAVIAGFSYPAVIHYSAMALGETALLFCFFLIAYHLAILLASSHTQALNAILLGVGIGSAQYAHPRGVAFVIAGIMVIFYALRVRLISRKQFFITAASTSFSIFLFASLKAYLLTTFYNHEPNCASLLSFVGSRLAQLNVDGLIQLSQVSFGQLTYILSSSFGLIIPGFVILVVVTWKNFQNCETKLKSNPDKLLVSTSDLLSGFVLLSFMVMFVASVMQMANAYRGDHFFYGRYNEVMIPALIIASIIFLGHIPKKNALRWIIASFFITLSSLLIIKFYPEEIFQRTTIWSNITSWLIYIHGQWEIQPKFILLGTFTAILVLGISFAVSRKLFIVVLMVFFTSTALYNFEIQHKGADRDWKRFNNLANKLGHEMSGMQFQVRGVDWTFRLKGEALQFAFPKAHVGFNNDDLGHVDAILDYKGDYCNDNDTIAYVSKASFCIVSDDLRRQVNIASVPLHSSLNKPRPRSAATIAIPENFRLTGIHLGVIDRIYALLSQGYYTGWFRYCLPTIDITLSQHGLSGGENYQLGFFITDSSDKWFYQWKVKLDSQQLVRDGVVQVNAPVQIPLGLPEGDYWLKLAVVDDQGWDWRVVEKIRLIVE